MTVVEQMLFEFCKAARAALPINTPLTPTEYKVGLEAVLRKHVEPMIAEAFDAGWHDCIKEKMSLGADYAERIIADLLKDAP